jgi:3-dehydroquinate synthetase
LKIKGLPVIMPKKSTLAKARPKAQSKIVRFDKRLKVPKPFSNYVLIFDEHLRDLPGVPEVIDQFPHHYAVKAGEGLKQAQKIFELAEKVTAYSEQHEVSVDGFVAMGGGSVTDSVGFLASIYKRGKPLIHIPSTWLAAIDSVHGGKTAVNLKGLKNQLGTFYLADEVWLFRELLFCQSRERVFDAFGEVFKIGLLEGGNLWRSIGAIKKLNALWLWKNLPSLIQAKMKIVKKDPFEQSGYRAILNLGHTWGHVFESQLNISHGRAVAMGTVLSLHLSLEMKILSPNHFKKIISSVAYKYLPDISEIQQLRQNLRSPQKVLRQDKKTAGPGQVRFVFLKAPGKPVVQKIDIELLVQNTDNCLYGRV